MKLLFLFVTLACYQVKAANYYLSSEGNDQNDGKSKTTSWFSLARLSEALPLLQSGDSILFKRGSTFHGQLIITGSGLCCIDSLQLNDCLEVFRNPDTKKIPLCFR